jgi:hypothetical protein
VGAALGVAVNKAATLLRRERPVVAPTRCSRRCGMTPAIGGEADCRRAPPSLTRIGPSAGILIHCAHNPFAICYRENLR